MEIICLYAAYACMCLFLNKNNKTSLEKNQLGKIVDFIKNNNTKNSVVFSYIAHPFCKLLLFIIILSVTVSTKWGGGSQL